MLKFKLIKENGNITNADQFKRLFNEYFWKEKDGVFILEVKKWYKKRTLSQNEFYHWVIVKELSEYFWISVEQMHDEIKYKFLSQRFTWIDWDEIIKIKSTTELNTVEFEIFLEEIRKWMSSEYWVVLSYPNESNYENTN